EDVDKPQVPRGEVEIAAVVGAEGLPPAPEKEGGCRELPEKAAERLRTAHGADGCDERGDTQQQLNRIGKDRTRPGVAEPLQYRGVSDEQRTGGQQKVTTRCHFRPGKWISSILFQAKWREGFSAKELFQSVTWAPAYRGRRAAPDSGTPQARPS